MTNVFTNVSDVQDDHTGHVTAGYVQLSINVALFLLGILIVVSNFLTILTVCTTKVLRTLQNKYIIALAKADMFVGISNLLLLIQKYAKPPTHWTECQYNTAILYSSINYSLFILLSVALDRYLYIVHPFIYMRHVTSRKIAISLVVEWTLATAHGFLAAYLPRGGGDIEARNNGRCTIYRVEKCDPLKAFQLPYVRYEFPAVFCLVCCGTLVLYGLIARTAKKHWDRKVKRLHLLKSADKSLPCGETFPVRSVKIKLRLFTKCKETKASNADVNMSSVGSRCPLSSNIVLQPVSTSMEMAGDNRSSSNEETSRTHFDTNERIDTGIDIMTDTGIDVMTDTGIDVMTDTGIGVLTDDGIDVMKDTGIDLQKATVIDVLTDTGIDIPTGIDQTTAAAFTKSKCQISKIDTRHWTFSSPSKLTNSDTCQSTVTEASNLLTLLHPKSDTLSVKTQSQREPFDSPPMTRSSVGHSNNTADIIITGQSSCVAQNVCPTSSMSCPSTGSIGHRTSSNEPPGPLPALPSNGRSILSSIPTPAPPARAAMTSSDEATNVSGERRVKACVNLKSLRWLRLMVVVFGLFLVCWAPIMISILVSWSQPLAPVVTDVFSMLGLANSAVNFFLYAFHTRHFRQMITRRIIGRCRD
ncbi:hypothetical protein Btru_046801 [Bulinus truncatus]|nr:hypothetical protein Btru_046801 [Bulinus truncatus]